MMMMIMMMYRKLLIPIHFDGILTKIVLGHLSNPLSSPPDKQTVALTLKADPRGSNSRQVCRGRTSVQG